MSSWSLGLTRKDLVNPFMLIMVYPFMPVAPNNVLRPKKKNVMFVVTWPKKKGSVGRLFFFFFFFFFFFLLPDILISSGNI